MELIHRLPKAALVTVVAFLFFGGTVGVVVAAGSEPLPDTLTVVKPKAGDRWEYEVAYEFQFDGESDSDTDTTGFEWLDADIVYDRDGVPHHVQPLQDVDSQSIAYVDMEAKRAIAQSFVHPIEETRASSSSLLGTTLTSERSRMAGNVSFIGYFDNPLPCGFFSDLQEGERSLNDPVVVDGGCLGIEPDQHETMFEAFETRTINGIPTVGFRADDGDNTTSLWYTPNIPYPVRIEMDFHLDLSTLHEYSESDPVATTADARILGSFEMTGFEPGATPWGVPSGPLPSAWSSIETAPLTVTGPDDSGVDLPYLLSEAFDGAMTDLMFSDLRDFMAAHPDAIVVRANHWAKVDGDYDLHIWDFMVWTDEGDSDQGPEQYWLDVHAERRIAREGTPSAIAQQATGPQDSYDANSPGPVPVFEQSGITWDQIPDTAPTVGSAVQRLEEATGVQATTYGFDFHCAWFCGGPQAKPDALFVGSEVVTETPADPLSGEPSTLESVRHVFWFDENGRVNQEERTESRGTTWAAGLLGTRGSTPSQYTDSEDVPTPTRVVWAAPPPEAAAGISFVAILIGGAYWLWPSLKTLPMFGLFSRVRSERMLEHQVRAAIYEVVQQQPGIHYQELMRRLGKGSSVIDHHIRKLQMGGYVSVQKGSGFTCFFPKGVVDQSIMAAVPALKTEGASRILQEVLSHPGQNISQVADRLGVAKSTVSYHVTRLRKAHLLEDGRELIPTDDATKALVYAA